MQPQPAAQTLASSEKRWGTLDAALDPFQAAKGSDNGQLIYRGYTGAANDFVGWQDVWLKGLALGGKDKLDKPYAQNGWFHMAASIYAEMMCQLPIKLVRKRPGQSEDEYEVIDQHPLLERLAEPNVNTSQDELIQLAVVSLFEDGDVFWFHHTADGKPAPLTPGAGREIPEFTAYAGNKVEQPLPDHLEGDGPLKTLKKWRLMLSPTPIDWPVDATTQIRRHNPYSQLRGMSLASAIMRSLQNDFTAQRFDDSALRNRGIPPYVYEVDRVLNADQKAEAHREWDERNAMGERDGKPEILGKGVTVKTLGMSPRDMEFREMRTWFRDCILSAFRMPLILLGREHDGGFSRAGQQEARKAFHEDAVAPLSDKIAKQITRRWIKPLGFTDLHLWFDDRAITSASMDDNVERFTKLIGAKVEHNKAAEVIGWAVEFEEDDIQATPVPPALGSGSDGNAAPEDDEESSGERTVDAGVAYHKAFEASLIDFDKRLALAIATTHRNLIEQVRENVRTEALSATPRAFSELDVEFLIGSLEPFQVELELAADPILAELFLEQARGLAKEVGFTGSHILSPQQDPGAAAFLAQKRLRLKDTVGTLADDVKRVLIKSLGESTVDVRQALRENREFIDATLRDMRINVGSRAEFIARTETTSMANGARMLSMQDAGIEEHRWLAVEDNGKRRGNRPHWQTMNGKTAKVGEPFSNGLRFPGDSQAGVPASEVVNCRCTTRPLLLEPEQ